MCLEFDDIFPLVFAFKRISLFDDNNFYSYNFVNETDILFIIIEKLLICSKQLFALCEIAVDGTSNLEHSNRMQLVVLIN